MAEKAGVHTKAQESKQKCSNSCKQNTSYSSSGSPADRILYLQRTAGNQAVQRMIKSRALQAKLKIGQPNDIYEQEADRVAEQVLRMPDPSSVSQSPVNLRPEKLSIQSATRHPVKNIQRKEDNDEEEGIVQMKQSSPSYVAGSQPGVPPSVHEVLSSPGFPLDSDTRAYMEPRFGHDFSRVRVHTGTKAIESTQAINARAYTVENNIVFGEGQYASHNQDRRKLLAHELMHIVQQSSQIHGIQKKNGPQKEPIKDDELICLKLISESWDKLKKGKNLEEQIKRFIFNDVNKSHFYRILLKGKDLPRYAKQFKKAYDLFFLKTEDFFVKELSSDPDRGVEIWKNVLTIYYNDIERSPTLEKFKNKVEGNLLSAYAAKAEKTLGTGKRIGKTKEQIAKIADVHIRMIIISHREEFINTARQGVNRWTMPIVPPDHWPTIISAASSVAGGAGSVLTVFAGSVLLPIGVVLIVAGVGASIYYAVITYGKEEEAYKQSKVEKAIKESIIEGYNGIAERMEAQEDLLALLCTVEALKEGLDLDKINRGELRKFVWQKMFTKDFPEDRTAGEKKVEGEISERINKYFQP